MTTKLRLDLIVGTTRFHALHEALAQYVENSEECEDERSQERLSAARDIMHLLDSYLASLAHKG